MGYAIYYLIHRYRLTKRKGNLRNSEIWQLFHHYVSMLKTSHDVKEQIREQMHNNLESRTSFSLASMVSSESIKLFKIIKHFRGKKW